MATFPHCDSSILHAPGECKYCDMCPEWQEYRRGAGIAFTGHEPTDSVSPCPSTWTRSAEQRDLWGGNRAVYVPPTAFVITEEPDSIHDLP